MDQVTSAQQIMSLHDRANRLLDAIRPRLSDDVLARGLDIRFNVRQASQLVGRSDVSIRRAEDEGKLPVAERRESGHRAGYSLKELNRMRDHFGTRPRRGDSDDPILLGVQNFKGGVGKSTIAVHSAQFLALQGYRVLMVDADPQASATVMFGIHPERDVIADEHTLLAYLAGEAENILYAIRPTHWDGLDIVPACLGLYDAEYMIASGGQSPQNRFEKLQRGLWPVAKNYDVVVIDPPPALGMISLNVLRATNALLIPTPPSSVDYSSTVSFLSMLVAALKNLEAYGHYNDFKFVQLLATKVDEQKSAHLGMREAMKKIFGPELLTTALLNSAEFDNASVEQRTVYEFTGKSTQVYRRCRSNLDMVMSDLELAICESWPSHRKKLRQRGVA